ncbi:unnamed protein product [Rangifer tarandus platyrhynchus]|uniref:Uncharacterized protein n=1 Tax=Rangifer tarandus platyrhynchus TaxID=3082113 RepID=A0ABN8XKJ8_RANTA|nr:unnamed protein product [Rangifer tarandus platyrhynchus]
MKRNRTPVCSLAQVTRNSDLLPREYRATPTQSFHRDPRSVYCFTHKDFFHAEKRRRSREFSLKRYDLIQLLVAAGPAAILEDALAPPAGHPSGTVVPRGSTASEVCKIQIPSLLSPSSPAAATSRRYPPTLPQGAVRVSIPGTQTIVCEQLQPCLLIPTKRLMLVAEVLPAAAATTASIIECYHRAEVLSAAPATASIREHDGRLTLPLLLHWRASHCPSLLCCVLPSRWLWPYSVLLFLSAVAVAAVAVDLLVGDLYSRRQLADSRHRCAFFRDTLKQSQSATVSVQNRVAMIGRRRFVRPPHPRALRDKRQRPSLRDVQITLTSLSHVKKHKYES